MIAGFFTNLAGTLVPTLLACGITYLLLITISERQLAYRVVFFSFLFIWMGSTGIGYIIPTNNTVYVAFSFAVLGTLLLLIGRKKKDDGKVSDQESDVPE
jgi:uncharacterized membrane protein